MPRSPAAKPTLPKRLTMTLLSDHRGRGSQPSMGLARRVGLGGYDCGGCGVLVCILGPMAMVRLGTPWLSRSWWDGRASGVVDVQPFRIAARDPRPPCHVG